MKCVVNWIPLRIRVRSRNTQPHLEDACKISLNGHVRVGFHYANGVSRREAHFCTSWKGTDMLFLLVSLSPCLPPDTPNLVRRTRSGHPNRWNTGRVGPTVCCFVLLKRYLGVVTVPEFLHKPRGYAPTIENCWRTSSRCPPVDNLWGLDSHPPLNVAGCTNPILFLFERTQQLMLGKPWWLHVWTSPKIVRPHCWGS